MSSDLFEQLAETPVPPPPAQFDRVVHQRLNRALVVGQVLDFAIRAIPYACAEFLRAIGGLIIFTASGKFPKHQSNTEATPDSREP